MRSPANNDAPVPVARGAHALQRWLTVSEAELESPELLTIPRVVYESLRQLLGQRSGLVLASSFFLLMLWGNEGGLQLVGAVWQGWHGPGSDPSTRAQIIPGLPWDQEWLSYAGGFLLMVVLPCLLIRLRLHQSLADYGLRLPPPGRRRFAIIGALGLLALGLPSMFVAAHDGQMRAVYPLFRGDFASNADFAAYEAGYLLFFVAIEFSFRGFLLFGLQRSVDAASDDSKARAFGYTAVLVAMLSYTAWHLPKPPIELWSTVPWGLFAGVYALMSRSILALILVHWTLNVVLDLLIWKGWF